MDRCTLLFNRGISVYLEQESDFIYINTCRNRSPITII